MIQALDPEPPSSRDAVAAVAEIKGNVLFALMTRKSTRLKFTMEHDEPCDCRTFSIPRRDVSETRYSLCLAGMSPCACGTNCATKITREQEVKHKQIQLLYSRSRVPKLFLIRVHLLEICRRFQRTIDDYKNVFYTRIQSLKTHDQRHW